MAKRRLVLLGLVLAAAFVAYLPSVDGEFLLDDDHVVRNPVVLDPWGQPLEGWLASKRPVAEATFAANYAAVGFDTRGWHLTNVAIHLAAVVLAFAFARATLARAGLARPEGAALAAAAIFALHPLQTESVSYVVQREESLASALYLAALLVLLARDHASSRGRRAALLAGAAALHVIALGVKPIAATLPAAWLLHSALLAPPGEEGVPGWRRAWRRVPAALPLFALSVALASTMIRGSAGGETPDGGFGMPHLPWSDYLATQLRAVPRYMRLALWPAGQSGDWGFSISRSFFEPAVLAGGIFLCAVVAGAVLLAVRFRAVPGDGAAVARTAAFGALFFFVALAPSSLVPLNDPFAEHRVYLGLLGLVLPACAGVAVLVRSRIPRRAGAVGMALGIATSAAAGFATARRAAVWTTQVAFWEDAAEKSPEKARVHLNLGVAYFAAHRPSDALEQFIRAKDLGGDYSISKERLLDNLTSAFVALGRLDDARREASEWIARFPDSPDVLGVVAKLEYSALNGEACEKAARAALARDPQHGMALKYLGMALLYRGDAAGARAALRAAMDAFVIDPMVPVKLAEAELQLGNVAAACAAYATAASQPGNPTFSWVARSQLASLGCRRQ